jgi:hypothetical protein
MKLQNILLSQAIRFGKISGPGGGTIYGLNLARACEERYGFLQAPRTLADYDLSKGISFLHGYFGTFVIDKFQIFPNGVLAEAKIDTDECDKFLEDVLKWVKERGGIEFAPSDPSTRLYLSHLEVQSDISLERSFPKLAPLGREIADILRGYGQTTPDYVVSGLSFGSIATDASGFRFEGREGPNVPHGIFFTQARLRTSDHLRMLESLEGALKTKRA